jgi:AcrR family transcriptional regulator
MSTSQTRTALRKRKEQAQRRKAILDSAREIFFDRGFMAATMDSIADGCDLAKGTIYLYFESKEELYVSIMAEGARLLKEDLDRIGDLSLPADKLLEEILNIYYAYYVRNPKYFTMMFLSSQPDVSDRAPAELIRECVDIAGDCMRILSDVIGKGMAAGLFRKGDSWALANILWSTVNGIIMHYQPGTMYRDKIMKLPLEEMLKGALNLALNGLGCTGGRLKAVDADL